MTDSILFLVMIAVATLVLVFVVALPDPRRGPLLGEAESLVRFSATAAIAVLATALMYLAEEATGSIVALALGDGAMVLSAWMVWTALSAVNGRPLIAPLCAVAATAASVTVSLSIPETPSTAVKLVLVSVGCLAVAVESLLGRVRASGAAGVFTGVGFGFGGYTLARAAVIAFFGTDSTIYGRAFTTTVSTLTSGLAVTATTIGTVLLFRAIVAQPSRTTRPSTVRAVAERVLADARSVAVYGMTVVDADLVRQTYGASAAHGVRDALVDAAAARFPGGVFALAPDGGRLVIVTAEPRGAPSATLELARAFDAAIDGTALPGLTEVEVTRTTARTEDELREAMAELDAAVSEARR